MKGKFNTLLAAAAATMLAAVACDKEATLNGEKNGEELPLIDMELLATQEDNGDQTKATIEEDNTVLWCPKDSVSVYTLGEDPCAGYKFKSHNDSTFAGTTIFSGKSVESESGYVAIYPYQKYSDGWTDSDGDGIADKLIIDWSGYNQEAVLGGVNPEYEVMAGYTPDKTLTKDTQLSFKHLFAYVKVTTTFPCDEITLQGNNSEVLGWQALELSWNGAARPSSVDDVPSVTITSNGGNVRSHDVTLKKKDTLLINPGTYYLAVIPQTLENGFTLTFKNVDGVTGTSTRKTNKSVTLSRAHVLNLGAISTDDFRETGSTLSGSGTESDPYLISNVEQYKTFAEKVNGNEYSKYADKFYLMMNDIDFEGATIPCIGLSESKPFTGTFSGNGHTLANVKISQAKGSSAIFAYTKNATIKSLTVQPVGVEYFEEVNVSYHAISGLVGVSYTDAGKWTKIDDCHVIHASDCHSLEFTAVERDLFAGGIVGVSYGQIMITNCTNEDGLWCYYHGYTSFSNVFTLGGILGEMYNNATDEYCIIDKCRFTGNYVHARGHCDINIGGILGKDGDGWSIDETTRITNCVVTGGLQANEDVREYKGFKDANVGGIIGYHNSDGDTDLGDPLIYNCIVRSGVISGYNWRSRVGGIMGYCYDDNTNVFNCAVSSGIYSSGYSQNGGALCGWDYGDYYHCHWTSTGGSDPYSIVANNYLGYLHQKDCSEVSQITAEMMNAKVDYLPEEIPASQYTFDHCTWKDCQGQYYPYVDLDF